MGSIFLAVADVERDLWQKISHMEEVSEDPIVVSQPLNLKGTTALGPGILNSVQRNFNCWGQRGRHERERLYHNLHVGCYADRAKAYKFSDATLSPAQHYSCCPSSPASAASLLWSCGDESRAAQCLLAVRLQNDKKSKFNNYFS